MLLVPMLPLVLLLWSTTLLLGACGERVNAPVPAASAPASAPRPASEVAAWFDGAELQAETQAQRQVLRGALADLLAQPADTLRAARYPALDGTPGARDLPQLLRQHLVSDPPRALDPERLFAELDTPALRAAVQRQLDAVDAAIRASQ